MQGVPIKFRGQTGSGKYVYGYYIPWHLSSEYQRARAVRQCRVSGEVWKPKAGILDKFGDTTIVDEDTIVQLVGYDAAGNELYEGDDYRALKIAARNFARRVLNQCEVNFEE